ncbi:DNA ligase 4 [Linum perenne]
MNMMFYFVNLPSSHTLDSFHKMVVKNGGTFSMNMNSSVTHCIAAESRGIKYQAAKTHGDIIHYSWILDCCSEKKLIPLQPKYFLFLSESSKKKLEEEIDEFSDSYFWDLDLQSMKQILSNIDASKYDGKLVDNFKKKHSPNEKWSRFCGCCIYFYHPAQSLTPDWESLMGLTLRRLKVELLMGGGKISASLAQATHLVVLTPQGSNIDLVSLIESFTERERQRIRNKRFNVVGWQWLEQSLEKEQKLEEDAYSLKPSGLEEWSGDECLLYCDRYVVNVYFLAREPEDESHVVSDDIAMSKEDRKRGDTSSVRPPIRAMRAANSRKRGRPASEARKGKAVVRRTRARTVNKPVKIYETKSDESSSDEVEGNVMMLSEGIKGRAEEAGKEKADVKEEGFNIEGDKLGMDELGSKSEPSNLEIHGDSMDDPVNAMLMDMIPSLGMKVLDNKEDQNRMEKHQTDPNLKMKMIENKEDQNQTDPALGMKMIENKEDENRTEKPIIQPPPPRPPPVQRKKVSYRELAEELLKE